MQAVSDWICWRAAILSRRLLSTHSWGIMQGAPWDVVLVHVQATGARPRPSGNLVGWKPTPPCGAIRNKLFGTNCDKPITQIISGACSTNNSLTPASETFTNERKGMPASTRTLDANLRFLSNEIQPFQSDITKRIHHTHPNTDLEGLIAEVFKEVPNVVDVKWQGGSGDHGADILVTFEKGGYRIGERTEPSARFHPYPSPSGSLLQFNGPGR